MIAVIYSGFIGQNESFGGGLRHAMRHWVKILIWALLSSTVIFALRLIEKFSKSLLPKLLGVLGEVTWFFATFYALPIILFEEVSIAHLLKRSWELFKKTWGESVTVNFSLGFLGVLIATFIMIPLTVMTLTQTFIMSVFYWLSYPL
jgi:hypothetical protein